MRERITSPIRAGTAPRPSTSRQPDEAALAGQMAKMISATMYAIRMPTVIIHCCSMVSDPRRSFGAYSAM